MKSVLVAQHGDDIDALISKTLNHPIPVRKKGELLVKVKACALAPGDIRVMKGHCDYFQSPGIFPYIPGGDLSGIVAEADPDSKFQKGDEVMVMFDPPRPLNGLAEYTVVKESNADLKPSSISFVDASALTSSALAAMVAAKLFVKKGDRVLVLGGSGGVGTFFVQLARNAGASYIASTSTDKELLDSLKVDRGIDYRTENWWEVPEFKSEPFDLIFDTVGGREPWDITIQTKTLKNGSNGGRYVVMNGDEPLMQIHNMWDTLFGFVVPLYGRSLWTYLWPRVPRYIWHSTGLDIQTGHLKELGTLVDDGKLRVVLDPISPVSFDDIDGIKKAFHLMESRHAHGKVVVEM